LGRSAQFPSIGIALSTPFSLSGRPKVITFQNPNGQTVETYLREMQTKFEDDPTVNEFGIAISLN